MAFASYGRSATLHKSPSKDRSGYPPPTVSAMMENVWPLG